MSKRKRFSKETKLELFWWAISGAALLAEYCLFTRFDELSIGSIPMAYHQPEGYVVQVAYVPPPLVHSGGLSFLFLFLMVPTGLAFYWFSKRLVDKLGKWLVSER